jgi:uroporphyrinogen III methyltransferase/synthase
MSSPLAGLRVLLTRPAEQAPPWAAALEAAGASVLRHPTIEVHPPPSWEPLDEALARLGEYAWLVFTSAAAVRFTLSRLGPGRTPAALQGLRVAAVGPETARALEESGLRVARIPEGSGQGGEALAATLGDLHPGTRILFPQAVGGREELRNALHRRGCTVDVVPASQTVPRRDLPPPPPFDVATFASPSALRAFVAAHGLALLENAQVAVIGPTTATAADALGLHPVVADAPTVDALIRAIATLRRP